MCSMVLDKNYQIAIEQNIAMPCFIGISTVSYSAILIHDNSSYMLLIESTTKTKI